jgi:hypothetical protein
MSSSSFGTTRGRRSAKSGGRSRPIGAQDTTRHPGRAGAIGRAALAAGACIFPGCPRRPASTRAACCRRWTRRCRRRRSRRSWKPTGGRPSSGPSARRSRRCAGGPPRARVISARPWPASPETWRRAPRRRGDPRSAASSTPPASWCTRTSAARPSPPRPPRGWRRSPPATRTSSTTSSTARAATARPTPSRASGTCSGSRPRSW